jgi:hypothetical protein
MDAAIAQKFQRTFGVAVEPIREQVVIDENETKINKLQHKQFKTGTELMYGGQGNTLDKNNLTTNKIPTRTKNEHTANDGILSTTHGGLAQPLLDHTNGEVTGDNKRQLQKQNKRKKRLQKALQQRGSQWTDHTGTVPCDTAQLPRSRDPYRNSMCPTGRALHHPAANILLEWATLGCPTCTGQDWSKSKMWEAVERGPHRSAMSPDALEHFSAEVGEKLRTKQARLVPWDKIKDDPP